MRAVLALITGLGLAVPTMVTASDWPQFRGPTGNGVSDAALPSTWGQDANVRWKIEVPGVAWSAPIVSGDKVFVTTAITENQQKPVSNGGRGGGPGGPGGGGPGGPGRRGPGGGPGRGGQPRFSPPRAGEILPGFFQGMLNLTESQQQALGDLQKQVDDGVAKLLTEEQHQEFQDSTGGGRRFR
ncbi:MAG: PQQ-binding-like beta-propeller repeat protein, partial [Planctomycetales bacterium]|nr:PQQ-binding-like beta-propeller repeat protein [Planctomycetales bacterium]